MYLFLPCSNLTTDLTCLTHIFCVIYVSPLGGKKSRGFGDGKTVVSCRLTLLAFILVGNVLSVIFYLLFTYLL